MNHAFAGAMTFLILAAGSCALASTITVGSKIFTESYILGETAAQLIESSATPQADVHVERKLGLGSTGVIFESLRSGAVDVYPDYTGTLAETMLKRPNLKSIDEIRAGLAPLGLTISDSLGFNDTYALAVTQEFARQNHLKTIGDLRAVEGEVRAAFSYEFMERKDGFHGMIERYGLKLDAAHVSQMEHSLVYGALREKAVNVIEVYSTDANIKKYGLYLLKDDLNYFPSYQAVWVARLAFTKDHPTEWLALRKREKTFTEARMRELNAMADIDKISFENIVARYLGDTSERGSGRSRQIWQRTREHVWLVTIALLFSVFVGIPLGILATRSKWLGQAILLASSLIQTIPALALLCFLIPLFGIGLKPALVALCLYSLLPVVLNTFTGIRGIDDKHLENAKAFGLSRLQILTRITLPIASPVILAGVKTATIVSIGTATLAALIGAGGYGALIVSGLSLNDIPTILAGAIPAAGMALVTQLLFGAIAHVLIPRGLTSAR